MCWKAALGSQRHGGGNEDEDGAPTKLPAWNSQAAAQINIMTLWVQSDTFLINNKSGRSDGTIVAQSFSFKIHLKNKL